MEVKKRIATLCFIIEDKRILLGLKKKGFGKGRWNGFGGKVRKGEKIEQAARRELAEEAKVKAVNIRKLGKLDFCYPKESFKMITHIFYCDSYQGKPEETSEMKPAWFELEKIPFNKMWPDDIYWLPYLLKGKKFGGKFLFKDFNNILNFEITEK